MKLLLEGKGTVNSSLRFTCETSASVLMRLYTEFSEHGFFYAYTLWFFCSEKYRNIKILFIWDKFKDGIIVVFIYWVERYFMYLFPFKPLRYLLVATESVVSDPAWKVCLDTLENKHSFHVIRIWTLNNPTVHESHVRQKRSIIRVLWDDSIDCVISRRCTNHPTSWMAFHVWCEACDKRFTLYQRIVP